MSVAISGFFWYDYIIFIAMLAISTGVGIYYGCFGTKQRTVKEYLLGNKNMTPIPIGISVAVANISGATMLIIPTEVYRYGAFYFWTTISMILSPFISVYLFLIVFYKFQITSLYEYLEKRFDNKCRLMASFFFFVFQIIYLSLAIYLSSSAFAAATGIEVTIIVAVTLAICTFYTAIGGLKSVIWTDFFQLIVIIISLVIISIIGITSAGGFKAIFKKSLEGGRLDIFDFDVNPTKRDSFWLYIVGYTPLWITFTSISQNGVQKYLALPDTRSILWASIMVSICFGITILFILLMGVLLYFRYHDCDPVLSKTIHKYEQLVPYYIMDVGRHIPGMSGLFVASLFSAALSTVSSGLNSLSGVIYKDFLTLFFKQLSESKANKILKLNVCLCGLICMGVVLIARRSSDIFPLVVSLMAVPNGPILGMFTLGVLFPRANAKGAFYGSLVSCIFLISISLPARLFYGEISYPTKSLSVDGCLNLNQTEHLLSFSKNGTSIKTVIPPIFRISHLYHCTLGALVTVVVGLVISCLTKKDKAELRKNLFSPIIYFLLPKDNQESECELQDLMVK